MREEPILVDSEIGKQIGFTSDIFNKQSFLFFHNNELWLSVIVIHPEQRGKGNFSKFLENCQKHYPVIVVPTPLFSMEEIVKKKGFIPTQIYCEEAQEDIDVWLKCSGECKAIS
jgi:hypothetical protein